MAPPVIVVDGASKQFYHYTHRPTSLQQAVLRAFRGDRAPQTAPHFDLQPLSLTVTRGEAVAIVGHNGSGKSTLLRLMAGVYPPSTGRVDVAGRVVAVLELGAAFQPELTGTENAELYAATLGMPRPELRRRLPQLLAFAGTEEFADVPLKYYSSGMRSRLAFAVATHVDGDTLLLDEVLAVGDAEFRSRCLATLAAHRAAGGTMVVVSHDTEAISALCTRGVWMSHGAVRADGPIAEVLAAYQGDAH
ncbi:MAG: ABC transporter ATP-binding protein [Gemmatimonadetes bacterium]|nr:ABC transporter ATP-binding protein [Gemmatimonadota bacterium]